MTKEPKLNAAVRIIAEWKDLDNEVRQFWEEFFNVSSLSPTPALNTDAATGSGTETLPVSAADSKSASPQGKKTEL
jgi:hypothetical protein